ncbi:hypothetical protein [uncultured Ruminococcus sp.]|uniref:hypothetical protein n=1 Tax=uncultured Ruminococcus sp. TaxID=165186 RepID=UPI0025F9AA07|nr:hypothetical protein [uncultured Ruminococcus sp.]
MPNNTQIVKDAAAAINTGTVTSGLLQPEQSRRFIRQTFEATPLQGLIRHEMRRARTGEIDKIGIANRILRAKTENVDDGYRAKPNYSAIEYACKPVRLPWEITEETLRENIEGQSHEETITNLMTAQLGVDLEDLYLNGDEATESSVADYDFLKLNDGWVKQIKEGGHIYDANAKNSGQIILDTFYGALQTVPNKYNNGKLRWIMSPRRAQEWEMYLLNKVIGAGGAVPENVYNSPARIPTIEVPALPDDCILLTDPQNLIAVNTYNVIIRKTTEGEKAIMQDKRFYVVHLDFDCIIEELDATAIITGLK